MRGKQRRRLACALALGAMALLIAGCADGEASVRLASGSADRAAEESPKDDQDAGDDTTDDGQPDADDSDSASERSGVAELDLDIDEIPLRLEGVPRSFEEVGTAKEVVAVDEVTDEPRAVTYSTRYRQRGKNGADEGLIVLTVILHDGSVDTSPDAVIEAMEGMPGRGAPEHVEVRGKAAALVPGKVGEGRVTPSSVSWDEREGVAVRITGRNVGQGVLLGLADAVVER